MARAYDKLCHIADIQRFNLDCEKAPESIQARVLFDEKELLQKKTLYQRSKFYLDCMVLLNDAFVQDKDGGNYAFLKEFARMYMTLLPIFAPINNTESEKIITIYKEIVMDMDNIYEILKCQRRSNALVEAWHRAMKADLSGKAIEIGDTRNYTS